MFLFFFFCNVGGTRPIILAYMRFYTSLDGATASVAGFILSLTTLSAASCFTQRMEVAPGIHLLWRHFKSFHPLPSPTAPVSEGACLYWLSRSTKPSINISTQRMTAMMIEMTLIQE